MICVPLRLARRALPTVMALGSGLAAAQDAPAPPAVDEASYYTVEHMPPPADAVIEVGGMDWTSDERLVLSTRRGQVWLVDDALADDPADARFTLFAEGLQEGLGLNVVRGPRGGDDALYVLQRGELSELIDSDGDDRMDVLRTAATGWGLSGNYHEFAFGLPETGDGGFYASFNVGFESPLWWHGVAAGPWRGWIVRLDPRTGELTPIASGLRSPCGLGVDLDGELYATDNQGDWMPVCPIVHVQPGAFYGHPASLDWTSGHRRNGVKASLTLPADVERAPAAVWLPYKWSRSTGNLVPDSTDGAFGPFAGQLFVGEVTNGLVLRVALEEVEGVKQGAAFLFRQGLGAAARVGFAPDGSLFAGLTNRGWGGRAPADGLARIRWTGVTPLELERVSILPDGFRVDLTLPLADDCTPTPDDITLVQYDYDWWWEYGSPERNMTAVEVTAVEVADDRRSLVLRAPGLRTGMVARGTFAGLVSTDGHPLLHDEFAYTINRMPGREPGPHVAKQAVPPPPKGSEDEGWLRLTYFDATDAWHSDGWQLVNAELDESDPTTFRVEPGNNAVVNVGAGEADDFTSRWEFGSGRYHVEFMLTAGSTSTVWIAGRHGIALSDEDADAPVTGTVLANGAQPARAPRHDGYAGRGQWHALDVDYVAPVLDDRGRVVQPARFSRVLLDEVVLHEDVVLADGSFGAPLVDAPPAARGPLVIGGRTGPVGLRTIMMRPDAGGEAEHDDAWVRLFNGSDLDGWRVSPDAPTDPDDGGWEVEDGVLIGYGPRSHIFSPRGDYGDVAVRAQIMINENGNSGMYARAQYGPGWPEGYEAQINSSFSDPQKTGSVYALAPVKVEAVPAGTWFDYEFRLRDVDGGVRLTTLVNGIVVSDVVDTERRLGPGHIAFQQHHDGSLVRIREVFAKEL